MIELMVIIIFFYLFGGFILAFLGTAIPVALGGVASIPGHVWVWIALYVVWAFFASSYPGSNDNK
jgi:hypothetical protein